MENELLKLSNKVARAFSKMQIGETKTFRDSCHIVKVTKKSETQAEVSPQLKTPDLQNAIDVISRM